MGDTVPRELAEAFASVGDGPARIEVGVAGRNFPSEVSVPGMLPLGATGSSRLSKTVFVAPEIGAAELTAAFEEALRSAGFNSPASSRTSGFGGEMSDFRSHSRGEISVRFQILTRTEGGSRLLVSVGPNMEKERERHMSRATAHRMRNNSPLPLLHPPAGTAVCDSGGGSSNSMHEMRASITPVLPIEALSEHYNAQLETLGWIPVGGSLSDSAGFICYCFNDSDGARWAGLFTVRGSKEFPVVRLNLTITNLDSEF